MYVARTTIFSELLAKHSKRQMIYGIPGHTINISLFESQSKSFVRRNLRLTLMEFCQILTVRALLEESSRRGKENVVKYVKHNEDSSQSQKEFAQTI